MEAREFTEAEVLLSLAAYWELGTEIRQLEHRRETIGKPIREFLERHGSRERLEDRERGLVARLQERESYDYDLPNMTSEELLWLSQHGLLRVDAKTLKALDGQPFVELLDLKKHRIPKSTTALIVEKMGA